MGSHRSLISAAGITHGFGCLAPCGGFNATFTVGDLGDLVDASFNAGGGVNQPPGTTGSWSTGYSFDLEGGTFSPDTGTFNSDPFGIFAVSSFGTFRLNISLTTFWFGADRIGGGGTITSISPSPVPLPAALPLLASALGFFGFFGWRRKRLAA